VLVLATYLSLPSGRSAVPLRYLRIWGIGRPLLPGRAFGGGLKAFLNRSFFSFCCRCSSSSCASACALASGVLSHVGMLFKNSDIESNASRQLRHSGSDFWGVLPTSSTTSSFGVSHHRPAHLSDDIGRASSYRPATFARTSGPDDYLVRHRQRFGLTVQREQFLPSCGILD
jgi:hypothetical protein